MDRRDDGNDRTERQYDRVSELISRTDADGVHGLPGALQRVCRGLSIDLPATGAAVSLMSDHGSEGVAAASESRIREVDELQFTTGEGPCHDAFAARRPVLTPDLTRVPGGRWPGYTSAVLGAGIRAVFAFPLHVGASGFGVMDVYSDRAGSLSDVQEATALTFAQIATEMILDAGLTTADGLLDPGLSRALDHRAEIHQAQGMVMVDHGVRAPEALALMRAHAFAHDRPLIDLARDIISGATSLDD